MQNKEWDSQSDAKVRMTRDASAQRDARYFEFSNLAGINIFSEIVFLLFNCVYIWSQRLQKFKNPWIFT